MEEAQVVLIVDDDVVLANSLSRALSGRGLTVLVAHDRHSALGVLGRERVHAVILDLQTPGADGLELLERMRDRRADRPRPVILLLSGHLDVRTTVRAVRAGAFDVLEKPISDAVIYERLRAGLQQGSNSTSPPSTPISPPESTGSPKDRDAADRLLGKNAAVRAVREQIRNVARFPDLSVVIIGETGTGKELVAEAIHILTGSRGPFVPVNCAAIPEALFESQLFGHEAFSFTGARGTHTGLLGEAHGGTIFFDELGEMPPQLQPKLLRVLETRSYRRIGGTRDLPLQARVISATNRRLTGREGVVRPDLYFRLAGFTILMPALRERTSDIDSLATHFIDEFARRYPEAPNRLTERALEALHAYDWPGNLRELKAVVQQAAVITSARSVGVAEIARVLDERNARPASAPSASLRLAPTSAPSADPEPGSSPRASSPEGPLASPPHENHAAERRPRSGEHRIERTAIQDAFLASGRNLSATARSLGLPRTTLRDRLRKYGLL
ncbi:MAG TPA: sigma-54 dependent transcriptional regulator [Polyangiaceae bacterium]|nr:sigma-54 dependent transcriptional regulator [Polyangiaceae bacterium]